jgi:hypothetical protein
MRTCAAELLDIGTLVAVTLQEPIGRMSARGRYGETDLIVTNARTYVGGGCVARIDSHGRNGAWNANFITSATLPRIEESPIAQGSYVLCGLWDLPPDPSLEDLNEFYDPGKIGLTYLCHQVERNRGHGRQQETRVRVIDERGALPNSGTTVSKMVRHAMGKDPRYAPALFADSRLMDFLVTRVLEYPALPVMMEPLKQMP